MLSRQQLADNLARFSRRRDAAVHADTSDLEFQLCEFWAEYLRNDLTKAIAATLPTFDADAWWTENTKVARPGMHVERLRLPDNPDEALLVRLDIISSICDPSNKFSILTFGLTFGVHKYSDAASKLLAMIVRPLAEDLTDRIRKLIDMPTPETREITGVPLALLPPEGKTRIFLSHRTPDKAVVLKYYDVLAELGFDPWIDKMDMKSGDVLHREIREGISSSCAAVFFVTERFADERWLRHEVDLAIKRRIELGPNRFSIITLAFGGGSVPGPLTDYLYCNVEDDLSALREVVRSLPICLGPTRWRVAD